MGTNIAMNDPTSSNDPLGPAYPHDPAKAGPLPRKSTLGSTGNITGLIILALAILIIIILLARDEPAAEPPPPAATEIQ